MHCMHRYLFIALVLIFSLVVRAEERALRLENTLNSRDLGGYSTADGRSVKWGMLYRADSLAYLNAADQDRLRALGLVRITDFRSESERQEAPDQLPQQSPAIDYRTLAINNPAVDVAALGRRFYAGDLSNEELLALTDRSAYINDEALREAWGRWLRSLAEPGALPQLFHCTAGKDRTGFAAAIVLLTLGVSREDVMADFLLSNEYLAGKSESNLQRIQENSASTLDSELLRQVLGVSPASLEGAFEAMEQKFGSVDGYIEYGLGVDKSTRERLQAVLLR